MLKIDSQHERGVQAGLGDADESVIVRMVVITPVQEVLHLNTGLEHYGAEGEFLPGRKIERVPALGGLFGRDDLVLPSGNADVEEDKTVLQE